MNYKIIHDEAELLKFIAWLPDLEPHEKFYACLFARKKYCPEMIDSNDKTQLKRFLATKENLFDKLRQLECVIGAYKLKGKEVPQQALVVYLAPNPRNLERATYNSIMHLTKILRDKSKGFNPHAEVLSEIQKAKSRAFVIDFDVDNKIDLSLLDQYINVDALTIIETRGGYHILVHPEKIAEDHKKSFYLKLKTLAEQAGDLMIPVPGTIQGGFVPRMI